jgi:molybdate transport system substrate-binding protein
MRLAALTALAALATGCGGGSESQLTVGAASSLRDALTTYARDFEGADVKLSFGGSDVLAAQIRAGVKPDVFVSADPVIARRLHAEGLTRAPILVATNRLVLAVPKRDAAVRSLDDLARSGVSVALGTLTVPVGAYADEALRRLPEERRRRIVAHVRTREPDVAGVLGKVAEGAVDAGIVYATDIATTDEVRGLPIPDELQPRIEYAAAVTRDGDEAAERFVAGLPDADALRDAGFGPP